MLAKPSEAYVRVVWAPGLVQGLGAGFALILRPDRIVGAKKYTQTVELFENQGQEVGSKQESSQSRTIEILEKAKRFEFRVGEIQSIEISPPGRLGPGKIVFRTGRGEETVKVAGTFGTGTEGILAKLSSWLEEFAPGRVKRLG